MPVEAPRTPPPRSPCPEPLPPPPPPPTHPPFPPLLAVFQVANARITFSKCVDTLIKLATLQTSFMILDEAIKVKTRPDTMM